MEGHDETRTPQAASDNWFDSPPRVSDALKKGTRVSVTTWGGRDVVGVVCDREQTGLLVETSGGNGEQPVYRFLPWSSVEQVQISHVAPRRVKFVQG